jgi:PucR C-terminal helix-turn-helix domain
MSELQTLIERLAEDLGAPAVLEDRNHRLIVHSDHSGEIDSSRHDSILLLRLPEDELKWFQEFELADTLVPIRLPKNDALGMMARLYVPVRSEGRHLAMVWVLDEGLADAAEAIAMAAADDFATVLTRMELGDELEATALAGLLSGDAQLRSRSATLLQRRAASASGWQMLSISAQAGQPELALAVEPLRYRSDVYCLVSDESIVLIVSSNAGQDAPRRLVDGITRHLTTDSPAAGINAGVGGQHADLQALAEASSESDTALRIAQHQQSAAPVYWSELGVERGFALLQPCQVEPFIDSEVAKFLGTATEDLVHTARVYLNLACDAKASSAQLNIHRTTLYYRLEKIKQDHHLDLSEGTDRFNLHLGLKLCDLGYDF